MNSHQKQHRESVSQIISDPELDYQSIAIRWAIGLLLVGIVVAAGAYRVTDGTAKTIMSTIAAHIMGVSASLFAAILPIENIRRRISTKISNMRRISDPDYLIDLLSKVSAFSGQIRKDEIIAATLKRRDEYGVIAEIKYKYKTRLRGRKVSFTFYRGMKEEIRSLTPRLMDNEFYWLMDETNLLKCNPEEIYEVLSLYIDGRKIENVQKIKSTNEEVRFEAEAPYAFNTGDEVEFQYVVKLPFEAEDYMYITHEFPTLGAEITVDYSSVEDILDVHVLPITGAVASTKIEGPDRTKTNYNYRGWIDPKNGYLVAWWSKKAS